MKNKLIVYLADDHVVARKGMSRLFTTFQRVAQVGEASNGKELIALCKQKEPDAVILDIEMPVMGGYDTACHLSEYFPNVKILILTMHTEETFVSRLVDVGVHGFLSKTTEPEEVERALYSIVDKDFYSNDIIQRALSRTRPFHPPSEKPLSTREMEVLLLICQEFAPSEISERLKISEKTFFNHRANILTKIGARTNVGLVRYAYENDLIKLENH